jgi:hypothetical protein
MMWSWEQKITPAELLKHIDMLQTLTASELKDELKKRDLPVSGRMEDLQTRLLNYDILNMEYRQMIPPPFWEKLPFSSAFAPRYNLKIPISEIREALLESIQPSTLNWTSFPEVLLDE